MPRFKGRGWNRIIVRRLAVSACGFGLALAIFPAGAEAITMSGMQLWLRGDVGVEKAASVPATLAGDVVQVWRDQSGQSNDATTTGTAPTFQPSVAVPNGTANAVLFSNDLMQLGNSLPTITDDFTVFTVVAANPATAGPHMITGNYGTGAGNNSGLEYGIYQAKIFTYTGGLAQGPTTLTNSQWYSLQADRGTGGGAVISLRINSILDGAPVNNAIPISSAQNWAVGNGTNYGGESFEGMIAEIIVYDRQLTTTERQEVEGYLDLKYFTVPEPVSASLLFLGIPLLLRRRGN